MTEKIYIVDNQLYNNTTMTYELVNGQKIPQPKDFKIPKNSKVIETHIQKPKVQVESWNVTSPEPYKSPMHDLQLKAVSVIYVNDVRLLMMLSMDGYPYHQTLWDIHQLNAKGQKVIKPTRHKEDLIHNLLGIHNHDFIQGAEAAYINFDDFKKFLEKKFDVEFTVHPKTLRIENIERPTRGYYWYTPPRYEINPFQHTDLIMDQIPFMEIIKPVSVYLIYNKLTHSYEKKTYWTKGTAQSALKNKAHYSKTNVDDYEIHQINNKDVVVV